MVTYRYSADNPQMTTLFGLSTDEKPVDCKNADIFYEMDTKYIYLFDEENKQWRKQ